MLVRRSSHARIAIPSRPSTLFTRRNLHTSLLSRSAVASPALSGPHDPSLHKTIASSSFAPLDVFTPRHIGPREADVEHMLSTLGYKSLEDFTADAVPASIRIDPNIVSGETLPPLSESELAARVKTLAKENKIFRSFIGQGYHTAVVPPVIMRNMLENPAWYTSYTPYQPEISQGRLESLLNFQTVCSSLTGLDIANASLLDEGTSAAEAMAMCFSQCKNKKHSFLVDSSVLPQTLSVIQTRAAPLGITVRKGNVQKILESDEAPEDLMGVLLQYPATRGDIYDHSALAKKVHEMGGLVCVATDLLALTLLTPPGEWGADIAVGNSGRFGVPMGNGGPHAGFFACKDELKRKLAGRLVGVSKDVDGRPAMRLSLQTREQHIKKDKATSSICTAQALLANMAASYAVYHGPDGLTRIAAKVHALTTVVKAGLTKLGHELLNDTYFDTLTIRLNGVADTMVHAQAEQMHINLRKVDETTVGVTLDESTTLESIVDLLNVFVNVARTGRNRRSTAKEYDVQSVLNLAEELNLTSLYTADASQIASSTVIPDNLKRQSDFLTQPVFNTHKSETDMMRYLHMLQYKDLSLVHAMMPLGSCTMKLNSVSSMTPLSQPEWGNIHPFAPETQRQGYKKLIEELSHDLSVITGFPGVTLQPNSGAQGEYTGLSVIRAYHHSRGDQKRDICLIPQSAHGTNPASAIMAGMKVVGVKNLADGSLDLEDLRSKAIKHKDNLAAFMITYPSTFGVFENGVKDACAIIHENGGQVYLDGANMNAQIGITNPAACGSDVAHLNLHKTLGIAHGGGGPGVGPIAVAEHLAPYLPGHSVIQTGGDKAITAVTSAPFGSASILTISWAYCRMLGGGGLTYSSQIALLCANYLMNRLKDSYMVKYTNGNKLCAHEFILDLAEFDKQAGIKVTDVAKRLQDYSFHPATTSWPVSTAMLIEPTECESLKELDRFADAMITIRGEIQEIIDGKQSKDDNILKNAPHPLRRLLETEWDKPYSRERAAYPDPKLKLNKFWPSVGRLQESYGDLNLICECPSVAESESDL